MTRAWITVLTALRPANSQTKPFYLKLFPTTTWCKRLQTASRNEQITFFQAMCRQSFGTVAASTDQLIDIQVFKARLHLIHLEKYMKLALSGS